MNPTASLRDFTDHLRSFSSDEMAHLLRMESDEDLNYIKDIALNENVYFIEVYAACRREVERRKKAGIFTIKTS